MPNTQAPQRRPKKIGIVIPAHNVADNISACLDAIKQAIAQLSSADLGMALGKAWR